MVRVIKTVISFGYLCFKNHIQYFQYRPELLYPDWIFIADEIRWDVDYSDDETNLFLATQKLSVEFELLTGC